MNTQLRILLSTQLTKLLIFENIIEDAIGNATDDAIE